MFFGFNLNHLFVFPVQDQEARKHFLVGCLIYLASIFIPILPWLFIAGYGAILIRQVLRNEKPHLVPWENWDSLLKDGARLFGIRLVYSLPLLLVLLPFFLMSFLVPFYSVFFENSSGQTIGVASLVWMLVTAGSFVIILPVSLLMGLLIPAAEVHAIANNDFSAGFRVSDWWPIFKKNWGGFLVALAILYGVIMIMSIVMQVMFVTVVFLCLLPVFMPAVSMYVAVVQYTAFAQAYKDGRDRLLPAPAA